MRPNPENERVKRQYLVYLKEAKQLADGTLDKVARSLDVFEAHTKGRDFRQFHVEQAISFKASLAVEASTRTRVRLSASFQHSILMAVKGFFRWLAARPGYKSRISYTDREYFNLSGKQTQVAKARREPPTPTLEQIRHVIGSMRTDTEVERRNQALIVFTLLTGARVGAIASFKLKHVDLMQGCVLQDAREVHTKFSKTFTTYFFPVGADLEAIVKDWVVFLRKVKLFGFSDPLFPATLTANGENQRFSVEGLSDAHWSSGDPIRGIFQNAFQQAGLRYFHPHSFRRTLVVLGEQMCRTAEEFKSWSQNLGHEDVLTTFRSYGAVPTRRQAEIIRGLAGPVGGCP